MERGVGKRSVPTMMQSITNLSAYLKQLPMRYWQPIAQENHAMRAMHAMHAMHPNAE